MPITWLCWRGSVWRKDSARGAGLRRMPGESPRCGPRSPNPRTPRVLHNRLGNLRDCGGRCNSCRRTAPLKTLRAWNEQGVWLKRVGFLWRRWLFGAFGACAFRARQSARARARARVCVCASCVCVYVWNVELWQCTFTWVRLFLLPHAGSSERASERASVITCRPCDNDVVCLAYYMLLTQDTLSVVYISKYAGTSAASGKQVCSHPWGRLQSRTCVITSRECAASH